MSISTGSHQTKRARDLHSAQTKVGPLKSKESIQGTSKSSAIKGRVEFLQKTRTNLKELLRNNFNGLNLKEKTSRPKEDHSNLKNLPRTNLHDKREQGICTRQTKVGPLKSKESIQGTSKSSAIKGRVEVPPEDSYKPTETTKKQFQWSNLKEKTSRPKEAHSNLKNLPRTNLHGAAAVPNGAIDTGSHQTKDNNKSALGQAKGADSSIPNSLALETPDKKVNPSPDGYGNSAPNKKVSPSPDGYGTPDPPPPTGPDEKVSPSEDGYGTPPPSPKPDVVDKIQKCFRPAKI
ncbi:hypothetical protein BASA60_006112 [Batrachochytrium salamandrivorans]|nr:hypothetical protein BASA60_006112 [Batrachochytrium salamandrivorans]